MLWFKNGCVSVLKYKMKNPFESIDQRKRGIMVFLQFYGKKVFFVLKEYGGHQFILYTCITYTYTHLPLRYNIQDVPGSVGNGMACCHVYLDTAI